MASSGMNNKDTQIAKIYLPQLQLKLRKSLLENNWRRLGRLCLPTGNYDEEIQIINANKNLDDEDKISKVLKLIIENNPKLTLGEFNGKLIQIGRADLIDECQRMVTPVEFKWKLKLPPVDFIGRHDLIEKLKENIERSLINVVTGIPGRGKTAFVCVVTDQLKEEYQCILWIESRMESLVAELHGICRDKFLIEKKEVISVSDAMLKLERYFQDKETLFVFDNLEVESIDILESLSRNPKHRTIITSQYCTWPRDISELKLPSLTEEEALSYVDKCFPNSISSEDDLKLKLVNKFGRSPLAIKISSSYIQSMVEDNIKNPLHKYLEQFHPQVLNNSAFANNNLLLSIAKNLERLDEDSLELARSLSFVGKSASMDFIEDVHKHLNIPALTTLRQLRSYALIDYDGAGYTMHDLVVMAIQQNQETNNDVIDEIVKYMKIKLKSAKGDFWKKHFFSFVQKYVDSLSKFSEVEPEIVKIMFYSGLKKECLSLLEKQNASNESYLTALANCYFYLYRYKEALPIYEDVLKKNVEENRTNIPSTLNIRHNIAFCLYDQGKYEEALTKFNEVLVEKKNVLGINHPSTSETRIEIALCLKRQRKYEEAFTMYNEILEEQKNTLGINDPITLITRSNIGFCLQRQGKYEEALKKYNEVLEKRKNVLGINHYFTLITRNIIANCLKDQGKYGEALTKYNEVLEERKNSLGINDQSTLDTQNNIAICLRNQSKLNRSGCNLR